MNTTDFLYWVHANGETEPVNSHDKQNYDL